MVATTVFIHKSVASTQTQTASCRLGLFKSGHDVKCCSSQMSLKDNFTVLSKILSKQVQPQIIALHWNSVHLEVNLWPVHYTHCRQSEPE